MEDDVDWEHSIARFGRFHRRRAAEDRKSGFVIRRNAPGFSWLANALGASQQIAARRGDFGAEECSDRKQPIP